MKVCLSCIPLRYFQIDPASSRHGVKTPFSNFSGVVWPEPEYLQLQGSHSKFNAYLDQDILHERLQIDLPQVDLYINKVKSTCSACSDSNLKFVYVIARKHECDVMIHGLPLTVEK